MISQTRYVKRVFYRQQSEKKNKINNHNKKWVRWHTKTLLIERKTTHLTLIVYNVTAWYRVIVWMCHVNFIVFILFFPSPYSYRFNKCKTIGYTKDMIKVAITLIVIKLNIYENERRWKFFECSSNEEVKRNSRPNYWTEKRNEKKNGKSIETGNKTNK